MCVLPISRTHNWDQLCRVGLEVKHIQDYSINHVDIFEENVKSYESMNQTKVISKVLIQDTSVLITNMDELVNTMEEDQIPYRVKDNRTREE